MAKWDRRNKVDNNMQDLWEYYKSNYSKPVDKKTYVKVCYLFNQMVSDAIVKESFEFKMPFRLGKIRIKMSKQRIYFKDNKVDISKTSVDWNACHKLWREEYPHLSWNKGWAIVSEELKEIPDKKMIVHTNDHHNGYYCRWHWDRTLANTVNQTAYMFKPVKGGIINNDYHFGKRGLAAWIKNEERTNEYYE